MSTRPWLRSAGLAAVVTVMAAASAAAAQDAGTPAQESTGTQSGTATAGAAATTPATATQEAPASGANPATAAPQANEPATTPERPRTATFRGAQPPAQDILAVSASLYGASVSNVQGQNDTGGALQGPNAEGQFSGLDFSLAYTPPEGRTFGLHGSAASSVRYYPTLSQFIAGTQSVTGGASVKTGRRDTLQFRGGVNYVPYLDFAALPETDASGITLLPRVRDASMATRRIKSYDADVDFTHTLDPRTFFSARYSGRLTTLIEEAQSSIDSSASVSFGRRISRRSTTRISFVHRDGQYDVNGIHQSVHVNDLEVSLDRDWARSPTRRTTVTFTFGPSLIEQRDRQLVRAAGGLGLAHPFGRSWTARAFYRRGVSFLEGFPDPVLSDSVNASISGLLTPKFDVSMSAGAIRGEMGVDVLVLANRYNTYTASTRGRYAFSRAWAAYAEYLLQYHQFTGTTTNVPEQNRSEVRFGITWYQPLYYRERARRPAGAAGTRSGQ